MHKFIQNLHLVNWLRLAMRSDTSYHKVRKQLWDSLVKKIVLSNDDEMDDHTEVDDDVYITMFSYLTSRTESNDSARLNFVQTLNAILAVTIIPNNAAEAEAE